jgi:hypothetical protein
LRQRLRLKPVGFTDELHVNMRERKKPARSPTLFPSGWVDGIVAS